MSRGRPRSPSPFLPAARYWRASSSLRTRTSPSWPEGRPLLSALQPDSGLLGKEYAKEVSAGADRHLHIHVTGPGGEGLWRISLDAVDGWALGAAGEEAQDDKGPFARLLGT